MSFQWLVFFPCFPTILLYDFKHGHYHFFKVFNGLDIGFAMCFKQGVSG